MLLGVAFLLAAGAICVFAAWRARRQIQALKSAATANIGMADDGYRKFEGHCEAIGGLLLSAPLTQTPCVWYRMRVEKWHRPTNEGGSWTTVKDSVSSAPFLLRDSTGICTVHPWRAEVTPSDKSQWYGSKLEPTDRNPPRLSPLESAQPVMEGNARYKYYEERVYADSPLTVVGEFKSGRFEATAGATEPDVEDATDADDEIGGSDEPAGADEALVDRLESLAQATTRARISAGTGRKPFILTTQLEAVHVATAEMGSQAALAMGTAFAGAAVWLLWIRFG